MPTVAVEGQFRFIVNTRENSFEPPHVHIWVGNEDVCRIELNGGSFMDSPPPGTFRDIMKTYARYAEEIWRTWDAIHGGNLMIDAVLVKNANRMMTVASLLKDGIELSFADGSTGLIPYADVPEIKERVAVSSLELPNPYEMVLETAQGERIEIPWDFARHYCDASYRPTVEAIAMRGRQTLGQRIRQFRESAGLTQEALARAANIGRVTLVRLERGDQTPRFKTLDAIAKALKIRVPELLVDPELLLQ